MKKIRIAQVGVGHDHAGVTYAALRRMSDIFEVVGYAEIPEDELDYEFTRQHVAGNRVHYEGTKKFTVEQLLAMDDLDAVAIETFDLNLVKYAKAFADKGVHIQLDKAPGESAEEFEKLLSTVKRKNLVLNLGYMYRFNPLIQSAFEHVRKGELGRVYSVELDMSCFYGESKRKWLEQFKGGMMQYLGCHLVDLAVRLMGVPDEIIPYNYATGASGVETLDVAYALLKYKNGLATVKSSMLDCGGYVRRNMVIRGEKATIEIQPLEQYAFSPSGITTTSTFFTPSDGWNGLGECSKMDGVDRYEKMLRAFASAVRGESRLEIDLETEARVHRCLLACGGIDCDYKGEIKL